MAREGESAAEVEVAAPVDRSFDADDERFFLAEDSLAPTAMDPGAIEHEHEHEHDDRALRLASPRRKAFARWVGGVVGLAAILCIAGFTRQHRASASATAAAAARPASVATAVAPVAPPAPPVAFTADRPEEPKATALDPAAAREARERARAALERGDAAKAVSLGIKSVELDPSDAEAWLILGAAEMASGEHGDARSTFKACAKLATRGPRHECLQMLQ